MSWQISPSLEMKIKFPNFNETLLTSSTTTTKITPQKPFQQSSSPSDRPDSLWEKKNSPSNRAEKKHSTVHESTKSATEQYLER